ncbi:MAG: hypothetical protein WC004_04645, partial [Candidatus Absconditabacterales bacterium]
MITTATIEQAKQQFINTITACKILEHREQLKADQLGKTGVISGWYKELALLDIEGKKAIGPSITEYKTFVEEELDRCLKQIKGAAIDTQLQNDVVDYSVSLPLELGHHNLLQRELARMYHIFTKYGFDIHDGHEITTKQQNFYSVNIPATHPATEIHDTLYLKQLDTTGEQLLLRTHTSNMQQELIKKYGP